MNPEIESGEPRATIWLARAIALAADLLQIAVFPLFFEGIISPLNDAVDLAVALAMTLLVGWHIAFLPSFIIKLLPLADLAPTWTLAVLYVTRSGQATPAADMFGLLGTAGKTNAKEWRPWYDSLAKPRWTPSPRAIGVIWTMLYAVIAVTFGFVFLQVLRGRLSWMIGLPFALNLVANVLFTPILFGLKNLWLATADIIVVLATILWMMFIIWHYYPVIAMAQLPYLVWVMIATTLQISIAVRNPQGRLSAN